MFFACRYCLFSDFAACVDRAVHRAGDVTDINLGHLAAMYFFNAGHRNQHSHFFAVGVLALRLVWKWFAGLRRRFCR